MSLRLVFIIAACGMALADNVDGLHEQKAESSFDTDRLSRFPHPADYLVELKTVHRRQSSETAVDGTACETCARTGVKIADISHDTGSLHTNKRSLDAQPGKVAEPGCCG